MSGYNKCSATRSFFELLAVTGAAHGEIVNVGLLVLLTLFKLMASECSPGDNPSGRRNTM